MENWKKFNENPFQLMLEQYDRKVIHETQLYERWERQTIREFNQIQKQLLEEGLLDTLKAAGQKVGDFLKGISEKVSDFVLKKSIHIVEMAKSAAKRTSTIGPSARNGWPVEQDILKHWEERLEKRRGASELQAL